MSIINFILASLCGERHAHHPVPLCQNSRSPSSYHLVDEKPAMNPPPYIDNPIRTPEQRAATDELAAKFLAVLRTTDKTGTALKVELEDVAEVNTAGWSEWLAERIFAALRSTLGDTLDGDKANWAVTLTEAYHVARTAAEDEFKDLLQDAKDHPGKVAAEVVVEIVLSFVAFGILFRIMRWVMRPLGIIGFAEEGPVAGSFAARWQARYKGIIPKGSFFSYLQRMGMTSA